VIRILALLAPALALAADITVEAPWSRATAPGQSTGAVFARIRNAGSHEDRLIKAECPLAATVELHGHEVGADGIARMRPVASIAVPAQGAVELKPGGLHIMFFGLKQALAKDGKVPVTLHFQGAGALVIQADVLEAGSAGPSADR
jgi:copper(I)-binding protein